MNYLFRTQDINSLINEKGVVFFTKDSILEMAQWLYKKLPLFGSFYTGYLDTNFNVGCFELFESNVRIGIYKDRVFDGSGLLFCKRYDEEYKEEIIEAIENFLYKMI